MDMKQRIIGVVVLLALGVILLPLIFDSETVIKPSSRVAAESTIPAPKESVASTALPNKNFSPAPAIIQPGAIEASADKMLEHQYQSTPMGMNEAQDFEDRDDDESSNADIQDEIAKEEESAPLSKKSIETVRPRVQANREKNVKNLVVQERKNPTQPINKHGNWIIQLGSFSDVSNANKLVADLKSKGFSAFTERDHNNKNRHKVLIGPEEDREDADRTVAKLETQHHIKSIVVRVQ